MSCKRTAGAAALLALALAGCSSRTRAVERLAILPFENLSSDASLDRMGGAVSDGLVRALTGSPRIHPSLGQYAGRSTQVLRGYLAASAGRLRLNAFLEDAARTKTLRVLSVEGPLANGVAPLVAALAKQLDPAVAQRGEIAPRIERARQALQDASPRGDLAARRRALEELARLIPASDEILRDLGETETLARNYGAAARWYQKAVEVAPDDPALWNLLGYAYAYARDLGQAARTLEHYRKLAPDDPNGFDSLGDAHYYLGRFQEAEKYYLAAYDQNAAFLGGGPLFKAARARLMRGDVTGADRVFRRYAEAHKSMRDASIGVKQAQWDYLCGRRREAMAELEKAGAENGPVSSRAWAQLAIWQLEAGDAARARESARRAGELAANPSDAGLAALCRFITEPPASASEWAVRAERAFPEPAQAGLKKYALAYALLFAKEFSAASLVVKELYEHSTPASPDRMNVLYAWTLMETGRTKEARDLLDVYPIPQPAGESPFASLSYPRQFQLQAKLK